MTASKSKHSPQVIIDVTQEIIDTSAQRDSSHCMIADAVKRAVPEAKYISVDLATIRFTDVNAGVRYIYLTPRKAQQALLDFDHGDKPEPFTVKISGAHVLLAGNARKGKTSLTPAPNGRDAVRNGGEAPPIGPLASGMTGRPTPDVRTGRRREFGLRAIIR